MKSTIPHKLLALLLATNYFTFQIEPFEEEYKANHPALPEGSGISHPSVTWESFDKQNAPKAFTVAVEIRIQLLSILRCSKVVESPSSSPYQPVRDKSPPFKAAP